eukprot:7821641-Prorocentrum_lima.AAC.1
MTSSLVGSEMCIRDRGGRPRKRPQTAPRGAGSGWREGRKKGSICFAFASVSYTHLTLPTICSV